MTEILKPCPFCGGEVFAERVWGLKMFRCPECGALVSFDTPYYNNNPEKTDEAWNRRMGASWIKTSERLPNELQGKYFSKTFRPSDDVLVVSPEHGEWDIMCYSHGHKRWYTSDVRAPFATEHVSYWMPLPKLPEEEENEI